MINQVMTKPDPILDRRIVTDDFNIQTKCYEFDVELTVPKNFIYDGASIPRALWSFIGTPYSCKFDTPACIHDYLYSLESNDSIIFDGTTVTLDRFNADYIMYLLLCENGVNSIKAYMMFIGIRCFGSRYYKKEKKDKTNKI